MTHITLRSSSVAVLMLCLACGSPSPTGRGPESNQPPTVTIAATPAGRPIVGVTTMTFSATGTDPDGDGLTFTWDLGDGVTRSGPMASRLFATEGSFAASVTASDGRGGTTTARTTVAAGSLSGTWTPLMNGVPLDSAELSQEGTTLYGAVDAGCCKHTFAGEIVHPRTVTLLFRFSGCKKRDLPFTGTVSAALDRIDTTGANCNVPQTRFAFVRR